MSSEWQSLLQAETVDDWKNSAFLKSSNIQAQIGEIVLNVALNSSSYHCLFHVDV